MQVDHNFFVQNYISRNQKVEIPLLETSGIELYIKREDEIHHFVSGNKFRKLKYNLLQAKKEGKPILTFGGAYSNHILASAVGANLIGLKSIGVIRGEELGEDLQKTLRQNSTLHEAKEHGMQFEFVTRTSYREKETVDFIENLKQKFGDFYLIPEGGTNSLAIQGSSEILTASDSQFDYICCCVGTGGTIAGLIHEAGNHQKVIGYPALKGDFLKTDIQKWIGNQTNWSLAIDYHFGGYAKYNLDLIRFINDFKQQTNIPLDPVYTGKMIYGILDGIRKHQFEKGSKIVAIHTGGLQGINGFNQRLQKEQQEIQLI
jgi:1-aminocyclopropane-1-carboxylate deaminase